MKETYLHSLDGIQYQLWKILAGQWHCDNSLISREQDQFRVLDNVVCRPVNLEPLVSTNSQLFRFCLLSCFLLIRQGYLAVKRPNIQVNHSPFQQPGKRPEDTDIKTAKPHTLCQISCKYSCCPRRLQSIATYSWPYPCQVLKLMYNPFADNGVSKLYWHSSLYTRS